MFKSVRSVAGRSALVGLAIIAAVPAAAAWASARQHAGQPTRLVLRMNRPAPAGFKPRVVPVAPLRVADPAAYAAQKAAANAAAARLAGRQSPSVRAPLAPTLPRNWAGQQDTAVAPSDSTGAIGTTRYIELINSVVAIYSRTSDTPLASGPLTDLTGCATAGCAGDNVFDPQIIWDPGTNRFFYVTDDTVSSRQHFLNIGFSTSATPTLSAGSWCQYSLSFGSTLPDYPKLGDTKNFQLIGVNEFAGNTFKGTHIAWVTKPASGSTCPAPSTFKTGVTSTLKNADGTNAFTAVPASQADPGGTGWAIARPAGAPATGAKFLTLFKVTKSSTGTATIPTTGTAVPVSAYKVPASAPQPGTSFKLDTMDGRNTQAVLAIDPVNGGVRALWTQHTVFGGAGAQVRWYEINPATHSLIQHGTITSSSLFTFDAAVSPDRRVNGTTAMFGGDMVIDVVQSSTTVLPTIAVASKIGTAAISALTTVATSAAADTGFDCGLAAPNLCRWGDYAAATPDPASLTTGTTGAVWGSSMLGAPGGSSTTSGWTTQNFEVMP